MPVWTCDQEGAEQRVWATWTTSGTVSTGTTYSVNVTGRIWNTWTNTTSVTAASNSVWNHWVQTPIVVQVAPRRSSAEERARLDEERARRQAEARQRAEERAAITAAAKDRARDLLRLLLTEEQWAAYEEDREFVVTVASGRRYKITHGYAGNIHLLGDDDGTDERLCIHPPMQTMEGLLPTEDAIAAQVLMLTADEEQLRRVANITPYRERRDRRRARAHDEGVRGQEAA